MSGSAGIGWVLIAASVVVLAIQLLSMFLAWPGAIAVLLVVLGIALAAVGAVLVSRSTETSYY